MAIPQTTQYCPSSTGLDLQAGLATRVHDPVHGGFLIHLSSSVKMSSEGL